MTHFWIFGTPLISPGRMKLETSNLAQRWIAVSNNQKNAKLGQKGSRGGHVTHFQEFCDPHNISGMNEARNFIFGTEMEGSEY